MSDWRECELERIGGTIPCRVDLPQDEATAVIREWVVRWGWDSGIRVARKWPGIGQHTGKSAVMFDFWGRAVVAHRAEVTTGDDVLQLLAELDEAGS